MTSTPQDALIGHGRFRVEFQCCTGSDLRLQFLPRISVNDVSRVMSLAFVIPSSKEEENGSKPYVASYIENFENLKLTSFSI